VRSRASCPRSPDPERYLLLRPAAEGVELGGQTPKTGYSATHAEYNEAVARGLRISVWTTSADQDGRQRDFTAEVRVFHTTGTYTSPDDLAQRIERRLRAMAADALAPWVKVGNTIFRATSIHDDGRTVTVVGRVRDNALAASLEGRRPDASYGRNSDTRITWPGGTSPVRVNTVVSETTGSRGRKITITGDRRPENRSNLLEMAVNNRTPEDLTELAARVAFLGEPNPLDTMSFMVSGTNPFPVVDGLGLRGCGRAGCSTARHRTPSRRARRRPHHVVPPRAAEEGPAAAPPRVDAPQAIHERGPGRANLEGETPVVAP
jgi:hypothetical protein